MSKKNPYWWFQGDSVDLLREQLVSANSAGQGARLEVKIDAKQNMTLRVVLDGIVATDEGGINKSHICPPDCP
jgi:hypothetical protein